MEYHLLVDLGAENIVDSTSESSSLNDKGEARYFWFFH